MESKFRNHMRLNPHGKIDPYGHAAKSQYISEALGSFKTTNTPLGNFYVVTNSKVVPDNFLLAMMQWWLYCEENEISAVVLSKDKFHEQVPKENIKKLSSLSFFNEQDKAID